MSLLSGRYNLGDAGARTKRRTQPETRWRTGLSWFTANPRSQPRGSPGSSLPPRWFVGLGIWIMVGTRANPDLPSTGTGMAPADPYAASLTISGLQMSEANTFSGAKVTYIDGQIANTGNRTLTAITVQVGFHSDVGQYAQRLAMPLSLIRTRATLCRYPAGLLRSDRAGPAARFPSHF